MKVKVKNCRSYITEFPEGNKTKLIKAFQRKAKDAHWQKKYNKFAGTTNFISAKVGVFPTGLLHLVEEWCEEWNEELEIDDQRVHIEPATYDIPDKVGYNPNTGEPYELLYYQKEAVEKVLEKKRGILKVATSGGKTLIASTIIHCIQQPTLFIVERTSLATQTKKAFIKEYGFNKNDVGIVGDKWNEQGRLITILVIQSAHKLDDLDAYKVVITDENHHSQSTSYRNVLKNLKEAYFRIGLSGTPFAGDELKDTYTMSQYGPIIYEIGTDKLVKEGVLSKPTIRFIEINQPIVPDRIPYHDIYSQGIVNNYERNRVAIKFANEFSGKVLVLFRIIEHGQILKKYIPKAMYVDGETPTDIRTKIFDGYNRSTEGVLLCSSIADEGINLPGIMHLINCSGGKSLIKNIQRLGRGLRKNDIMKVNVIDFFDTTNDILERHSRARMKTWKDEGHDLRLFMR